MVALAGVMRQQGLREPVISVQAFADQLLGVVVALNQSRPIQVASAQARRRLVEEVISTVARRTMPSGGQSKDQNQSGNVQVHHAGAEPHFPQEAVKNYPLWNPAWIDLSE